jgi:hypothetical protein
MRFATLCPLTVRVFSGLKIIAFSDLGRCLCLEIDRDDVGFLGRLSTYAAVFATASRISSSEVMLYRSKTDSVL